MAIQSGLASAPIGQTRVGAAQPTYVRPKARVIVARLMLLTCSSLMLSLLSVISATRTGIVPTIIEPLRQFLPGQPLPVGLHCGEGDFESCYARAYTQCYESADAICFISASIEQDGKTLFLTIDIVSRTIALTSISVNDYRIGDLFSAWGTPTGFSQSNRAIDIYWGTRSAHLTTCSFLPESRADFITYHLKPPVAAPWHGFVRVNGKDC